MASDEIVWQIINQQFCSYKLKTPKNQTFCRNTDNVTGLCNRQSCPLANSRYATIRSSPSTGALYLCMKTIERAHTPAQLWERIKLSNNYAAALAQIDAHMTATHVWPKFLIHKCKQRLTRLTQVAIRTRKLAREAERMGGDLTLVPKLAPKVRRREATRERKAEAAAKVERAIERELVERLRSGAYGDKPLNVEEGVWRRVLRGLEREGEGVRDRDLDEGVVEEEEEEEEEWEMEEEGEGEGTGLIEYVSGDEEEESVGDLEEWLGDDDSGEDYDEEAGSEDEGGSTEEDFTPKKTNANVGAKRKRDAGGEKKVQQQKTKKTKQRLEIEYEDETVPAERELVLAR